MPSRGGALDAGHMSAAEFRRAGHELIDWIASYWERVGEYSASPVATGEVKPGDLLAELPAHMPEARGGEGEWARIMQDVERQIVPRLTHWQHPGFFAYFPCTLSGPAVLGELLSAGLNVNGMLWSTSPAATELETRVLDWCAELFALPGQFFSGHRVAEGSGDAHAGEAGGGCLQSTASEGTLVALLAARQRAAACAGELGNRAGRPGPDPARMVGYTSEQAHSSVQRAGLIAGLEDPPSRAVGVLERRFRLIASRADGSMDPDALDAAMAEDLAAGRWPGFVTAAIGATGLGYSDDLEAIARVIARRSALPGRTRTRCWLHVDAAWAGPAAACPEHRGLFHGLEHADSFCVNPHKWMLTNFDCDLFWTRDVRTLTASLSLNPAYLRNEASDAGAVIDYRDWQIPLGRRFRALKLWFVLRHYGAEGIRAFVRQGVEWAAWLEREIEHDARFELAAPRSLSLVCFRLRAGNEATRELMRRANATGRVFLSHTEVKTPGEAEPRYVIRMAIGGTQTRMEHVRAAWDLLRELAGG